MQSMEAVISLLFVVVVVSGLAARMEPGGTDDSLYRVQLAEDCWRVLYLRGDFHDFSNASRPAIERDLAAMGAKTGMCYFIGGTEFTNCRGGNRAHGVSVSLEKTVIFEGRPRTVAFSMAPG